MSQIALNNRISSPHQSYSVSGRIPSSFQTTGSATITQADVTPRDGVRLSPQAARLSQLNAVSASANQGEFGATMRMLGDFDASHSPGQAAAPGQRPRLGVPGTVNFGRTQKLIPAQAPSSTPSPAISSARNQEPKQAESVRISHNSQPSLGCQDNLGMPSLEPSYACPGGSGFSFSANWASMNTPYGAFNFGSFNISAFAGISLEQAYAEQLMSFGEC